jgi:hypothetical protein
MYCSSTVCVCVRLVGADCDRCPDCTREKERICPPDLDATYFKMDDDLGLIS